MPKIFSSEHAHSYKTYTFGYAVYAQRLEDESLDPIYEDGFLPYSGEPKSSIKNLYYMARSARVKLDSFFPTSENRRIKNKFENKKLVVREYPASKFAGDKEVLDFCLNYFEMRHGHGVLSKERLKRILNYSPETKVVEYRDLENIPRAYIIEIHGKEFTHYWFSFYDLSLAYQSFGMWLMINRVENAKVKNKKYCYLGTVYGSKALYKTNIPSLEYWNGEKWTSNMERLKERAKTDGERTVSQADEFKDNEN